MKNLKTLLLCCSFLFVASYQATAQEDDKGKRPVRAPFESVVLIDNQTVIVPTAKTLEFDMMHRFGTIENGKSDLFGLYAPGANIRLGLTYSLKDNLALGVGFTKLNKYVDFNLKYAIMQQTRDWNTPISLTYFGNMAIDTRQKELFEVSENPTIHRLSSFNQLIIATRVNRKLSLQVTPSISYFNKVELGMNNHIVGVGIGGRYKLSAQSSFVFDYNKQMTNHDEVVDVKPNLGFGWEISTSTHQFQIFVSSFKGILPQHNMVFNENEFDKEGLLIGFNITRLWNF